MWQGILTYTHAGKESGPRSGLVITMDENAGDPKPNQKAALREAEEYLKREQRTKPEGVALGICTRHISYDPPNSGTWIDLIFK